MAAVTLSRRLGVAALLRRPGYPGFLLTVSLSRVSGTMFQVSGVLLVLARTGSVALAGVTAAAATLPGALTGPVLGAWLEVAERRRVLIVADQLLSVAGLAGILLLAGHAPDWTVPAAACLYSVTRPLTLGSFSSALAELAGAELLDIASAIEASSLNGSFVLGPALAGALVGATSAAVVIELQIALTFVAAVLIALNPVFEARAPGRSASIRHALRDGTRALIHHRVLRAMGIGGTLAAFGWGMMVVGFPLYAARDLHAGAHAGGYMWAGMAGGSIIGTVLLARTITVLRAGLSWGAVGLSALLWPLAGALGPGIALVCLTGIVEGPGYSGWIALRQRHTPPALRAQLMTTTNGIALVASSAGSVVAGLTGGLTLLVVLFCAVNLVGAVVVIAARERPSD